MATADRKPTKTPRRSPARRVVTTAVPAQRAGIASDTPPAPNDAANAGLDWVREFVVSSLNTSQRVLRGLQELQQQNAQMLRDIQGGLDAAISDAARADDLQALLTLHADWAQAVLTRAAQNWGAAWVRWLDDETKLVEQAQDEASEASRRWLGRDAVTVVQPAVLSVTEATPLAMLGDAQTAVTEMTRQWTEMLKGVASWSRPAVA